MKTNNVQVQRPVMLLSDDDSEVRRLVYDSLERLGCVMEEPDNGEQALAAFKRIQPEIVLLDLAMRQADAFELCASLHRARGGERVSILAVAGRGDLEGVRRAIDAGATDFLIPPVDVETLGLRLSCGRRSAQTRERLSRNEERNRGLIKGIPHLVLQISKEGTVLDFEAPRDFDLRQFPDGLRGRKIQDVFFADAPYVIVRCIERVIETAESQVLEHNVRMGNDIHVYETRILPNAEGEPTVVMRDVTERRKMEKELLQLAYHDPLTGLLNQHSMRERIARALELPGQHGRMTAILWVDVDHLKRVNATFGHELGDVLLQRVADRMLGCARRTDRKARLGSDQSIKAVARMGGDDFVVLLTEISHVKGAANLAKRLLDDLSQPFVLDRHEVYVTASIGIAVHPHDGAEAGTLLKNADSAMHHAKAEGRNNFQFYTSSGKTAALKSLTLEGDLRMALARRELFVEYQPEIDLKTGETVGLETLVRWDHPTLGLIPPLDFIPLAEETGLILPIGEWILSIACMQNAIWHKSGLEPIRVAVNLSGHQFRQRNLIKTIAKTLTNSRLDPQHLELEITESTLMENAASTIHTVKELKSMGVRLAVDDFGTGYSSLSYLRRFPLDVLKIDRSFIRDVTINADDAAITRAIIAMAHNLNLEVIAEGVENEQQLQFLQENNCDMAQGYYYCRPLTPAKLTKHLEKQSGGV